MVSFFTCTRPNRSRVDAIDKPDRPEQAFDQYDIPQDPEKIFTNDFSMVGHEKMIIFGVFDDFIHNFTYYDLYWRKVKVLTQKKYAIRFFMSPLDFSWDIREDSKTLLFESLLEGETTFPFLQPHIKLCISKFFRGMENQILIEKQSLLKGLTRIFLRLQNLKIMIFWLFRQYFLIYVSYNHVQCI